MAYDDFAQELCRRHAALVAARTPWEAHWSQVARRVLPSHDEFQSKHSPGQRRTEYVFDSTAILGLDRFVAAIEGFVAPRGQRWHGLTTSDESLNRNHAVKLYLEEVTSILFKKRYASAAAFASEFNGCIASLGAFGSGPFLVSDTFKRAAPIGYRALHVADCYVATDMHGRVDTLHREFEWTARQAAQRWPDEQLPEKVRKAIADKKLEQKFKFLHVVAPAHDYDPGRVDAKGMPIGSWYIFLEDKRLISRSGFHTMPVMFPRYQVSPREDYGRSVAMAALPDIKMVNEIAKTVLRASHRAVDPPLLLADDGVLSKFNNRPGAANVGGLDDRGNPMVRPLEGGANLPLGFEMLEQARRSINDAFLVTLFQVLVDGPDRQTATEVIERMREKGVLLAPAAGRIETELLSPMIAREIDILARAGMLPDMPGELVEAGGEVEVLYQNPIARAARGEEAAGFLRTMEALAPVAQIDPSVYGRTFDLDRAPRELAEINGVPARWLTDPDKAQAMKDAALEKEQLSDLVAAAPIAGKAALDFAKAQEVAGAAAL